MARSSTPALAGRSPGCLVCDDWKDEMISLIEQGTKVCRTCSIRVGRTILTLSPPALARFWPAASSVVETRREVSPLTQERVEIAFTEFKASLAAQMPDDRSCHFDLAVAYGAMGRMVDAIREAAIALGDRTSLALASQALNWIFAQERARPDALRTIVGSLRDE